jgi:glycosyltransferase involved in cell wall biosynthesis
MTALDLQNSQRYPAVQNRPLRIAVASSGLGHINRGIEAWASDLAAALRRAGQDVRLFQGGGVADDPTTEVLRCRRRFEPETARLVGQLSKLGGWRYGFGSGYQAEQTTFVRSLWPRVRRDFDLLHVQDPWIALLMDGLHRRGLSRPRVILAHGTEEPPTTLARYSALQHLAPCYLEDWKARHPPHQAVFAVPNFVDTGLFAPGDRAAARAEWGLPPDDLIVLCVAAIKRHHKRVDALIQEFEAFADRCPTPATLVVAGGREAETDAVVAEGRARLGDRIRFLEQAPRSRIHTLYQAADVFALASLHEMMPIAVLEALASGLPVACNDTPTLRWMTGPAASLNDICRTGALSQQLTELQCPKTRATRSRAARAQAETTFSEPVVIQQVLSMYTQVAQAPV